MASKLVIKRSELSHSPHPSAIFLFLSWHLLLIEASSPRIVSHFSWDSLASFDAPTKRPNDSRNFTRVPQAKAPSTAAAAARMNRAKQMAKRLWKQADAVCFDVDSTLISEEGIDGLAEFCGAGAQVSEW